MISALEAWTVTLEMVHILDYSFKINFKGYGNLVWWIYGLKGDFKQHQISSKF